MEVYPGVSAVVTDDKGVLDSLCKIGLGLKWFTAEDKLVIDVNILAEEFHFILVYLFPPLQCVPL